MGLVFDLSSAHIVSYLTSARSALPRVTYEQLSGFLRRLAGGFPGDRPRVISADPDFPQMIRDASQQARATLGDSDARYGTLVEPDVVTRTLESLRSTFSAYDLYILPVGAWEHRDVLDRFAQEAAYLPGEGILVLIPDFYDPHENIKVMDPLPATADAVKYRGLWPGAVFVMRTGRSCFVPIDEAHQRLARLAELWTERGSGPATTAFLRHAERIATAPRSDHESMVVRRLIHLSDLHLGTTRAAELQSYLQAALLREFAPADQIVVTGDLFDQPRRRHFREYRRFAQQLQMLSGHKPVVVPGNHDQRVFGNSILRLGRYRRQLLDVEWQQILVDDAAKMVFMCFDSSRTGDLARGEVDATQLMEVGTKYQVENRNGRLDEYEKVVLVHHHPYPYAEQKETLILDPRGWVGREEFIELRGADRFLRWCAARGVGLILHGHKHKPRLIEDHIQTGDGQDAPWRRVTTVGCGSSLGANGGPLSFNVLEWQVRSRTWTVDFWIDPGDGSGFRSRLLESQPVG